MTLFYVYVDWTTEDIPRPFYVGKGVSSRLKRHARNKHHANISAKHGMERRVEYETLCEAEAFDVERKLILELGTHVYSPNHWGANYTLGGDGVKGSKRPALSQAHKDALSRAASYKRSDETKRLMSEAANRRMQNPAYRQKLIDARKRRWEDNDYRKNHSEKMKLAWKRRNENTNV